MVRIYLNTGFSLTLGGAEESYFRSERKAERAEWESRIMSQLRHDPASRKTHVRVAVLDSLGHTYQEILESATEVRPPQCIGVALEAGKLARGTFTIRNSI